MFGAIQKLINARVCNKRTSIYAFIFIVFYSLKRCINKYENMNSHMGSTHNTND